MPRPKTQLAVFGRWEGRLLYGRFLVRSNTDHRGRRQEKTAQLGGLRRRLMLREMAQDREI